MVAMTSICRNNPLPKGTLQRVKGNLDSFAFTWEQRKLTDIVEFFSGLTYTPSDVQETGTLVLRSSNVSNGEIVDADNVYVDSGVVNSENVKDGDIMLRKAVKPKLLGLFVAICTIGIIIVGYLFNIFQYLLV